MACTRLEWSYNISLLGIYVQFPTQKNFAIYIHQNSSSILIQLFFNLNLQKCCQKKTTFFEEFRNNTYTSCNGPQICLLHPLTKFLFKETQNKIRKHSVSCLILIPPFKWIVKQRDRGHFFMFLFNQRNKNHSISYFAFWEIIMTADVWKLSIILCFLSHVFILNMILVLKIS